MFTFALNEVRAVIERRKIDAAANGGFGNPHYGLAPGKDERPGVWLVGDEGVYLLSNGNLAEGQKPLVCYAEECNPTTNPDYWHYKRQHFGGDDGVEFIDAETLLALMAASPEGTHLRAILTSESMELLVFQRF